MDKPSPFKTLSSRIAYHNPWMRVREDAIVRPEGSEGLYGVVETKDSVMVIAVNAKHEVCMIHTYRYPAQKWCWELPIGKCDDEDPSVAGPRELLEETGITAFKWRKLGKTRVYVGLATECKTTLLATDLTYGMATDTDEGIEKREFLSINEINRMIAAGEIDDDQTLSALYLYRSFLDQSRQPGAR